MDKVYILDFGSQYTQLIARKIRELGVYSEIFPYNLAISRLKKDKPSAIVLSGGPQSVYDEDAPLPSPEIFELGIPILGICYGLQLMSYLMGGKVEPSQKREYGFATLEIQQRQGLLTGLRNHGQVWMSHGDKVHEIPSGFEVTGITDNCETAVIEDHQRRFFGVQFHPEVIHSKQGLMVLSNFLFAQAGITADWGMGSFIDRKVAEVREAVGRGKVICGLSGGVDSLVASLIIHKAIQDQLICIFVDNGLLRKGQYQNLMDTFRTHFSLNVVGVDASELFLEKLLRVRSPERKRKIIGREFIRIFEREAAKVGGADFLAQGTIYPDVIESNPVKGPSSTIKSHHNVGGLPEGIEIQADRAPERALQGRGSSSGIGTGSG